MYCIVTSTDDEGPTLPCGSDKRGPNLPLGYPPTPKMRTPFHFGRPSTVAFFGNSNVIFKGVCGTDGIYFCQILQTPKFDRKDGHSTFLFYGSD